VDDKAVGHHPVLCFASVNVELNLETFHTQQVPVITAPLPVDPGAKYPPGTFPYFKGMSDRITVMNGINAPKVIECMGSDGHKYRQLAKSGNDDLRQDAVCSMSFLSFVKNLVLQFLTFICHILVG
jgi:hypothetical protein